MSELQNIIKSKYDNDWIALSNSDKIFQLTNLVSSQKNHYGFKPQGLWLGLGDNWLQYIKDNDMTDWISEYCSAFSIELGSNILILKDKEDYVNFTKRYSKNSSNIKWEVVAKKYDGIIAYAPRRFAFDRSLSWTYGWDITSACIWNSEGIKDIDEILNGCNDESFESFKRGGKIHFSCVLINKDELLNKYNQVHENLFSHHSTIEYKPKKIKGLEVGKQIDLKITGRLTNDKLDVLLVDNPYSKNKYPHITLSTAKGVQPVDSNFEIENNLDKIVPLNDSIDGEITVCMFEQGGEIEVFKKGGSVTTWKNKYNKKYGYPKNESHSLKEISKDTGVSMKGIRQIYNKGIGAYKTNPSSVRPNVTSKEQWAYARVYSSVMGGKASKVDDKELKMEKGGILNNPNFKEWFGDSKVVDEKGNPLVVYHGTGGNFDKFKDSIDGGSWFISNPIVAEDFVFMGNPSIIPVYLSLKNPYIADLKGSFLQDSKEIVETIKEVNEVQSDKYDGIILKNALDYVDNPIVSDIYVSFEPTQIKSAIGNSGEYDPSNPSIVMEKGGVLLHKFEMFDIEDDLIKNITSSDLYHGSTDISWFNSLENIDTFKNTKNAKSKYLFLSPNKATALNYSFNSIGMNNVIKENSGVLSFDLKKSKGKNLTKKELNYKSIEEFEDILDKYKEKGFDYVVIIPDGKNYVILNNEILNFKGRFVTSEFLNKKNQFKKGGKLFDERKKELQLIAEGEKTIRNLKRGYDKYLTILKDLKNGLKKDKEINLMGVFLNIQADIRRYNYLVEQFAPLKEKYNKTTTDIDNLIREDVPNLKIYPYTIDELDSFYYKVRGYEKGLENSFKQGGILNNPNFKSWFGDSKVVDEKGNPLVVYHGTDKEFNIFDESYTAFNTDNQGFLGRGFYFTTRKEDASQYGNIIKPFYLKADKVLDLRSISYEELSQLLPNLMMKDGISWSEGFRRKKEIADSIENVSYRESGRNGFYYVDYEIDGEDYDVPNRTIGEIEKDNGLSVAVFNAMSKNGYLDPNNIGAIGNYFNPQLIREEMIRMGYNAVISNGTNITDIGDEIMVFSPNQIKSAIGNSGEYDTNNPSIIMEKGGEVLYARKRFLKNIIEAEKEVKNSKVGYSRYAKILKDYKELLKNNKDIDPSDRRYELLFLAQENLLNSLPNNGNDLSYEEREEVLKEHQEVMLKLRLGNSFEKSFEKGGILNNPNFKEWFGDSKVVDEKGNPLVVYHGTTKDFDVFSDEFKGVHTKHDKEDVGFHFTNDPSYANGYSETSTMKGYLKYIEYFPEEENLVRHNIRSSNTFPVYLKIENPYYIPNAIIDKKLIEKAKSKGHDGIIGKLGDFTKEYVVFEPTQIKSAIGNSGEYDTNNPSIIMAEGGQVCTYDFDGYDLAKKKCGNDVDIYLIPAEYEGVSIFLFKNHFPLWLYYNYLARIVISKEDIFIFKKQLLENFKITNPVRVLVKPYNDKFWKKSYFDEPRSYMSHTAIKGIIQKLEIVLVQDGSWANKFKERTSGLTIPNPKGVHLNTVIHEFAHLIDVVRYNNKNPNEKILVNHERGFLIALTDILIACKRNEIPIVSMIDSKALIIQKALQKPSFVERYKDTYGLNVFDGSVPKDLKEYDERFASLKGSKLNKEQAKELFNLIKKYQDEVLMGMAMINPNKANRLFKSTNDLLTELKKYS